MKGKITITDSVREHIRKQLDNLRTRGVKEFELSAKDIEKELNLMKRTPIVCSAMRSCGYSYEEIYSPPKGNGPRLRLKYFLSLEKNRKTDNPSTEAVRELNIINATPTVCSAMRSCGYSYEEIYSPPKGNGTRLRIKYLLDK